MKKTRYWLLIVWLSFKWIFRITLGDEVIYQGKKYIVVNGPCAPFWDLQIQNGNDRVHIHQKEFKKIWSIKGMIRSFQSGYSFYMTSWYSIWIREGIKSWMKSCNIW